PQKLTSIFLDISGRRCTIHFDEQAAVARKRFSKTGCRAGRRDVRSGAFVQKGIAAFPSSPAALLPLHSHPAPNVREPPEPRRGGHVLHHPSCTLRRAGRGRATPPRPWSRGSLL